MKKILLLGLIAAGLFAQYYDPRKYINSHGLDSCRVYRHDGAGSDTIFFRAYLTSSTVKADSGIFNYLSGAIAAAKKSDSLYNKGSYVYGQYFLRDNVPDTASKWYVFEDSTWYHGKSMWNVGRGADTVIIFPANNKALYIYCGAGIDTALIIRTIGDIAAIFDRNIIVKGVTTSDSFWSSANMVIGTGSNERMRILNTGNISIGGTSPGEQFEVRRRQYFGAVLAMTDGIYWDHTAEAKISDGAEYRLMAFQDDTLWVGKINDSSTETFTNVWFDIQSPGTDVTLVPTYWNGSAWSALSITDGTSNFTVDGSISFSVPGNWTSTTVHGVTGMFIMLVTSTNPTIDPYAYVTVPDTTDLFGYYIQAGDVTPGISMDKYGRTYFVTGNDSIVFHLNTDTTLYVHQNNRYGIYARANDSFAIFGTADKKAIYGYANDYGVWGFGADYGVYGETSNNFGVYGNATNWYGTCGLAAQYGAYGYGSTKYGGLFVSPNIGLFAALDKTTPTSDTVAIFGMSDNYYPSWGTNFYPRSYIDSLGQYHIIGGTQIRKNAIAVDTIAIPTALDTNYLYASNDTLFLKSKLGSQYLNLTQATVLFKPGWMLFDQMKPATNDSSSSSLGSLATPYGKTFACSLVVAGKSPYLRVYDQNNIANTAALCSLYRADTNNVATNRVGLSIVIDSVAGGASNHTGLSFGGTGFSGATDKWISCGNGNSWSANGFLYLSTGLRQSQNSLMYFLQESSNGFIFYYTAGNKGDFIIRDGNNTAANLDFCQWQDSNAVIQAQIGNNGEFYTMGLAPLADTVMITNKRFRVESDSIQGRVSFAGVSRMATYIPGLAATDNSWVNLINTDEDVNDVCVLQSYCKTDSLIINSYTMLVAGTWVAVNLTDDVNYLVIRK